MQTEKSDIIGNLMWCLFEVNQLLVEFELVTFLNNYPNMAQTDFVKNWFGSNLAKKSNIFNILDVKKLFTLISLRLFTYTGQQANLSVGRTIFGNSVQLA